MSQNKSRSPNPNGLSSHRCPDWRLDGGGARARTGSRSCGREEQEGRVEGRDLDGERRALGVARLLPRPQVAHARGGRGEAERLEADGHAGSVARRGRVDDVHRHRALRLRLRPHLHLCLGRRRQRRLASWPPLAGRSLAGREGAAADGGRRCSGRCGGRVELRDEAAGVSRPLLVDCDGLRVGDDRDDRSEVRGVGQVEAEHERRRDDAPRAKVGPLPREARTLHAPDLEPARESGASHPRHTATRLASHALRRDHEQTSSRGCACVRTCRGRPSRRAARGARSRRGSGPWSGGWRTKTWAPR
mmetsp:Transcript_19675/g.65094  ORF Transcript_19675/g.65094 Transcript_19675/m.65094 type:complete len:304 (+) Transcript_19675:42-953(+)